MANNTVKKATDFLSSKGASGTATDYPPLFASIGVADSGSNEVVAAVASKKIRVVSMCLVARGTVDMYIEDSVNTALFGNGTVMVAMALNTGFSLNLNELGHFETGAGNALEINLSDAIGVAGSVTYITV